MKKKLLYLTSIVLFSVSAINAQTKVWDFGANPMGTGFTDMITVANQTTCALFPSNSLTGGVEAAHQVQTLTASHAFGILTISTFAGDRWRSDNTSLVLYDQTLNNTLNGIAVKPVFAGATTSGRLASNGTDTTLHPRAYTITLTLGQTITIYLKVNITAAGTLTVVPPSGSAITSLPYVAAGTNEMRTIKFTADKAGDYRISDPTNKPEFYRIYDGDVNAGINLSTNNFEGDASLDIFSIKNKVYVTNIVSETGVQVYSINGALVKSVKASENTNFELNSGVYIIKAQSADGQKTVKVIVQ